METAAGTLWHPQTDLQPARAVVIGPCVANVTWPCGAVPDKRKTHLQVNATHVPELDATLNIEVFVGADRHHPITALELGGQIRTERLDETQELRRDLLGGWLLADSVGSHPARLWLRAKFGRHQKHVGLWRGAQLELDQSTNLRKTLPIPVLLKNFEFDNIVGSLLIKALAWTVLLVASCLPLRFLRGAHCMCAGMALPAPYCWF